MRPSAFPTTAATLALLAGTLLGLGRTIRRRRQCADRRHGCARPVPRDDRGLQRLPHAAQDGTGGSGTRHGPDAVRSSPEPRDAGAAEAARRSLAGHGCCDQHGLVRSLGRQLHSESHARSGDGTRPLDAAQFRGHDPQRSPPGPRSADPAAHAVPDVQAFHGRGFRGDLCVPAHDPGDPQPGARAAASACLRCRIDAVVPSTQPP